MPCQAVAGFRIMWSDMRSNRSGMDRTGGREGRALARDSQGGGPSSRRPSPLAAGRPRGADFDDFLDGAGAVPFTTAGLVGSSLGNAKLTPRMSTVRVPDATVRV